MIVFGGSNVVRLIVQQIKLGADKEKKESILEVNFESDLYCTLVCVKRSSSPVW